MLGKQILPRPLRHGEHGVGVCGKAFFQSREQAPLAVEAERDLGDEHEIDFAHGEGGVGGDEARFAPHQLDDADAVEDAGGLDMGAADGVGGLVHRRFEAEGMGDEIDVVVDGFRNPDNGDVLAAPGDFLLDGRRSLHRPVAADDEQRTYIQALKGGGDFG